MKKIFSFMVVAALCFAGNVWAAPIEIDEENPYENGFDTETLFSLPDGWSALGNGDASVESKNDIATRGGSARALQVRANRGQSCAVILPEFSAPIANLTIAFYPRKGSNNATYSVGYVADDVFTKVAGFDATSSYPAEAVSCAFAEAGAPEGALIAIEVKSTELSGSKKSSLYIDDVTVTFSAGVAPATCAAPKNLAAGEIQSDAVSLTWEQGNEETIYQVACVLKDETPTWESDAFITVNGLSTTLEGLIANTDYDVFVRSFCDEENQSAAIKVSFTTLPASKVCDKVAVDALHPWNEDFEAETADDVPACWEVIGEDVEFKVAIGNLFLDFEGQALKMSATNEESGIILFPEFEADFEHLQIQFSHKDEDASKSGSIDFGFYQNDEFTLLKSIEPSTTKQTIDAIALTEVPADARLAFHYTGNYQYEYAVSVDDIVIEAIPGCAVPTGLTVSEISSYSAVIVWTSDAEDFALQLMNLTEEGEWEESNEVITNPFVLTGLDELTAYAVRVKAVCSLDDESDWTEPVEFSTICAVKAFGHREAFTGDELPACWDNAEVHGSNEWSISDGAVHYATTGNIYNHATLITPWIAVASEGTPSLLFNWKNSGAIAMINIEVEGEEPAELADLSEVAEDWTTQKFYLTDQKGKVVRFHFYAESSERNKHVYLDNFQVVEKPLLAPTDLSAEAIAHGAELAWNAGWDEAAWDIQYKKADEAEWILVSAVEANAHTLQNLDPDVEYEAQVRAVYGEEQVSAWTESVRFTPTEEEETAVENINAGDNTTKRILNGLLVIIRDGVIYNAQGTRVAE